VGGLGGEVRGGTPEEVWSKFEEEIKPEVEERFGLFLSAPLDRQAAFQAMRRDAEKNCWIMDYYFSK
jgi:hypothetical protein